MSSDILAKRNKVKQVYSSPSWDAKVDKMSDNQVIAVYLRLQRNNKF